MLSGLKHIVRNRRFERVWEEVSYLQENYGIDYIWNVSDNLPAELFSLLLKTKPKGVNCAFRFYVRSKEINEETAEILSQLNTYEVFLGVESGNNEILKGMNKGETVEDHIKAVKILSKYKIKPRIAFVLGAEGETEESLQQTYKFAKYLLDIGADSIACSVFTPVPGSRAFYKLLEKEGEYQSLDLIDVEELQENWIKNFTSVDLTTVKQYIDKFKKMSANWGKVF